MLYSQPWYLKRTTAACCPGRRRPRIGENQPTSCRLARAGEIQGDVGRMTLVGWPMLLPLIHLEMRAVEEMHNIVIIVPGRTIKTNTRETILATFSLALHHNEQVHRPASPNMWPSAFTTRRQMW